jgi:hypothetical protein
MPHLGDLPITRLTMRVYLIGCTQPLNLSQRCR